MTMTTTIGALVDAQPALAKLAGLKLDAKARYHVVKLLALVAAETREHYYEPRQSAFKELGEERPPTDAERVQFGGDPVIEVKPEQQAELRARVKDLCEVPVTIPWGPVTSTMLEPYTEFTAADMLAMGPLFALEEVAT